MEDPKRTMVYSGKLGTRDPSSGTMNDFGKEIKSKRMNADDSSAFS
jgi:hypothetical protein